MTENEIGQPLPTIGVDKFYFAPLIKDEPDGTIEYGESVRVPGLVHITFKPNSVSDTFYADNGPYTSAAQTGDITVDVDQADIPLALRAMWYGQKYEHGVLEEGQINPIEMGVGYRVKKSNGSHRNIWLHKGKAILPDEDAVTQGSSVNFQTSKITIKCSMLVANGKYRRVVDDDSKDLAEGVNAETIEKHWFTSPLWDYTKAPDEDTGEDPGGDPIED